MRNVGLTFLKRANICVACILLRVAHSTFIMGQTGEIRKNRRDSPGPPENIETMRTSRPLTGEDRMTLQGVRP